MLVDRCTSEKLREVIINAPAKAEELDAEYREFVRTENINLTRIKTNRSKRRWVKYDVDACTRELIRRGEEHTIPLWARKKFAAIA